MNWNITNNYEEANHHPVAVLNGDKTRQVLSITSTVGSTIEQNAVGSTDPDGDSLVYSWSFYEEHVSYTRTVTIQSSSSTAVKFEIPKDAGGKTIYIILEIHDNGRPNLYAYRRMIVNVRP
ncbi:hypothetical protein [Marinilabilia sp.]|uniref:hypothetical protein n=1 Tax=Marinilabilia sp. TaxID=2021252 RepID=UPI0025C45DBB|nr:hypothetical protein [Marinilabilia sp.]